VIALRVETTDGIARVVVGDVAAIKPGRNGSPDAGE
jgi:hypothetical protein